MEEVLHGVLSMLLYYFIAAGIALTCRVVIYIPNELFRKCLHCILLGSLLVFVFCFETWWISALSAVGFAVLVYPILSLLERIKGYGELTTERKQGELKNSLLLAFSMFAVVISICWGWFHDRSLVLASIYAWGFGDAAAALVGKRWGKHKIHLRYADQRKSWEGSATMFLVSLLSVTLILLYRGGLSVVGYIVTPLLTAMVSTLAELYSKNGYDTVICPLSAMAILLPLTHLFGGLV